VLPDSPAQKAGLRRGDLVIGAGATAVVDPQSLLKEVDRAEIDAPLALEVLRNGKSLHLSVKPAPLPGLG